MKQIGIFFLATVFITKALCAVPVEVMVRSAVPPSTEIKNSARVLGILTVTENSSEKEARSFQKKIVIPGKISLDLEVETIWRATLEAPGFWSEPKSFTVEPDRPIGITAWPTAQIRGMVTVPRGERLPREIGVRFEPAPESEWEGKIPRTEIQCPVEESRWQCEIPAVVSDLRLRSPGYLSHFFWDFDLQPHRVYPFDNLRLRRGASLVGMVEILEGPLPEEIEIKLAPAVHGGTPSRKEKQQLDRMTRVGEPDERGFFHFESLAPGSYVLTGTYPGGAPVQVFPVHVLEKAETELAQPILLSPPLTLEVHLTPSLNMDEEPWSLNILEVGSISGSIEHQFSGRASVEGVFQRPGVAPGNYLVRVRDDAGNIVASEEHELHPGSDALEVELPLVMVEGTLHYGDEPVAGDLLFGGQFSSKQVKLSSDHEGHFFGYLPHDGEWLIYISSEESQIIRHLEVEVEGEEGFASLEIRLPETRISGRVVDPEGNLIGQTLVRAYDPKLAQTVVDMTDPEGNFIFHALPEGKNIFVADDENGASAEVEVQVVEKFDPAPDIVLHPYRIVTGTVTGASGPIPGALVRAVEYEAMSNTPRVIPLPNHATTGLDGGFDLRVTASSERMQLVVYPPGYALHVSEPMPIPRQPLRVEADQMIGSVVFELDAPLDWEAPWSHRPSLWIDGVPYGFETLAGWRHVNRVRESGKEFTVPALPPGRVEACFIAPNPENYSGMPRPKVGDCQEGFLSPGGELRLRFTSDSED